MKTKEQRRHWSKYEIERWLLDNRLIQIKEVVRKTMAYKDFTFADIERKLGVKQSIKKLFPAQSKLVEPSKWLLETIAIAKETMPLTTEKAVSEGLVSPILQEVARNNIKKLRLFSGEIVVADKSKGLNGECDFIFAKAPQSVQLRESIIQVAEAKKNDAYDMRSLSQTAAQMIGTRIFNQKNTKENPVETIYGVCTSGYEWVFLKLEEQFVYIDTDRYNLANLPQLLGVLQTVVDFYD
jgi:hypothetical protein